MRQIRQLQEQGVPPLRRLRGFLVQCRDPRAQVARFGLFRLGFGGFLLGHQRADLLGDGIARGLEFFHLGQALAPPLVQGQHFADLLFLMAVARGQALADKIGLFANQSNIEHRRIIKIEGLTASGEWGAGLK